MASEPTKEVDPNWQKKAGLDLRLDKTKILKDALTSAEENGLSLPKTDSAQVLKKEIVAFDLQRDLYVLQRKSHKVNVNFACRNIISTPVTTYLIYPLV